MAERYSFAVPNISVDGSVVWTQDNIDNTTLTEGYVSADDETQYLSVLDSTSEISLENLNIALTNPKLEVEENTQTFITQEELMEQAPEEATGDQVVVYSVEGSEDLYGIQIAQDEDGNLQKYQFQFRKNNDGQLEAIPETVQLLPMEEEIQEATPVLEGLEEQEALPLEEEDGVPSSINIFVQEDNSNEHILPDRNSLEEEREEENQENHMIYETEEVDIKPAILTLQNVKQEMQEQHAENESLEEEAVSFAEEHTHFEHLQEEEEQEALENGEDTTESHTIIEYNDHIDQNSVASEENSNFSEPIAEETQENHVQQQDGDDFEHIEVNPDLELHQPAEDDVQDLEDFGEQNENSDLDDSYHIVEGVHITGDVEEPVVGEKATNQTTNILRHALKTNKEQKMAKKDNKFYLYVVQHPEKENMDSLSMDMANLCKPFKTNPRSILKSSFHHQEAPAKNDCLFAGKRFARCKEAVQARILHNFINKTTIPQAPVRKDRLPRKQKIKPVERMDEEIVVQEVMVSNNGFVETIGAGFNKENLEVTEYVELSDSDDDYDPKKAGTSKKKKKHKRKKIEITISDESDASSVIELDESDEDDEEQEVPNVREEQNTSGSSAESKKSANTPTKRRRGRPPKNKPETSESPSKRARATESAELAPTAATENPEKPEIPCPKCEKTFPSQNSLKTHLQHHSLQSSLRNAANTLPEYKYKCHSCESTFKNGILLRRHACAKNLNCPVCKRKFQDQAALIAHKRIHAKEKLLKTTTIPPPSPKRTSSAFKQPAPPPPLPPPVKKTNSLKCKTCGKVCSSVQILTVHMKSHKEYACATCSSVFLSQLALEKHLRENCVKSPQTLRRSMRLVKSEAEGATEEAGKGKRLTTGGVLFRVSCEKCSMQFHSFKALFIHKVKQHGLDTPDKSVLSESKKKTLHKVRREHGGVPATKKLQDAYASIRNALDFGNE